MYGDKARCCKLGKRGLKWELSINPSLNTPRRESLVNAREALGSFRLTLLLLCLPALELALLRWVLKYGLGVKIGWNLATDYDFLIPIPIACWIAVIALTQAMQVSLRFSLRSLWWNLTSVGIFFLANFYWAPFKASYGMAAEIFWVASLLSLFVSAFSVVIPISFIFRNPNTWVILPSSLIALSTVYSEWILGHFWTQLCVAVGLTTRMLLSPLPDVQMLISEQFGWRLVLKHPDFAVSIGKKCAGMDGFVLFWQVGTVFMLLFARTARVWHWVSFFSLGTTLMLYLNAMRIAGLFLLGVGLSQSYDYTPSVNSVMLLFHLNLGWLLYVGGIFTLCFGYLALVNPRAYSHRAPADCSVRTAKEIPA